MTAKEISKGHKHKFHEVPKLRPSDQSLLSCWMLHGIRNISSKRPLLRVILCLLKYKIPDDFPSLLCFPSLPSLSALSWIQNDKLNRLTRGCVSPKGHRFDSGSRPWATCPPHRPVPSSPRLLLPKSSESNQINQMQALGEVGAVLGTLLSHLQVQRKWLASIRSPDCYRGYYGPLSDRQAECRIWPQPRHMHNTCKRSSR